MNHDPTRFLKLGLRTNPFCQRDHSTLAELLPPPSWVEDLIHDDWHCLVLVGPSGVGKTTTAHMLRAYAERQRLRVAYHRLNVARARWPVLDREVDWIMIDSIQSLAWWRRGQLRQRLAQGTRHVLVGQRDVTRGVCGLSRWRIRRVTPAPVCLEELEVFVARCVASVRAPVRRRPPVVEADALQAVLNVTGGYRWRVRGLLFAIFEALPPSCQRIDGAWVRAVARSEHGGKENNGSDQSGGAHDTDDDQCARVIGG